MAKGFLIVDVYLDDGATPVDGATVTITGDGYKETYTTDESGKTSKIELDAPETEYSIKPQYEIRPYSKYDVKAEKKGLNAVTIKGVQIFPDDTSIQDIYMKKKPNTMEVLTLPEHELWESSGEKIPENPIKDDPSDLERVLPNVIIPEYIIVHDGTIAQTNAPRRIVTFIDYIKNVASSEIFSTWHRESIKANVHAIVSFTLNRIYTEWYRGLGHTYTITSSPAHDQKFTYNRTIFQSISNVVDEYFRYFIRLEGMRQPFLAQYNDGIKTNNRNWLSQWGSQEMALRGVKAIDILKHYYTRNLALHVAPVVIGLPNSFPGVALRIGSCGQDVQTTQIWLNRIRTHYPAIPAISPADGQYGQSTANAVRIYQRTFNIPQTGVIDIATWFSISRRFTAIARLAAGL